MAKKGSLLLHRIIGILVAISIIIAGICLIAGCCYIYFSEEISYSRIAVADVFEVICLPVYICLFFVVLGLLAELLLPSAVKPKSTALSSETVVKNLLRKRDASAIGDQALAVHYREKGKRTLNSIIMTALTAIACGIFFAYSLDQSHFDDSDINGSVISALYVLIPCVAIPFLFYLYSLVSKERGYKRELTVLKSAAEGGSSLEHKPKFEAFDVFASKLGVIIEHTVSGKPLGIIRISLIAVALLCLVFGLVFGGTADVFTKASNICTECIGLG